MIPNPNAYELDDELESDFEEVIIPDKTYRLDFDNKCIASMIDGKNSREQAILKIIMTEVEEHLPYDDTYGCALVNLIGEQPPLVQSLVKDSIREGILADDRFESVSFTSESLKRGALTLNLTVTCIDSTEIDIEGVEVNV